MVMKKYSMIFYALISLHSIHGMDKEDKKEPRVWDAKGYKKNSSLQYQAGHSALHLLELQEKDRVIDFGCGDGKITRDIAEKVFQGSVLGIDLSENMIQQASNDHKEQENLSFEHADIASFKSDKKFTKAVALCSLSWVKDQGQAYKNIAQVLEHDGKFVALISNAESAIMKAYLSPTQYDKWKPYFENYQPSYYPSKKDILVRQLEEAGFDFIKVKQFKIPLFMSKDDLFKTLAATPGVKDAVPQEHYMNYLNDVVEEYIKIVPQNNDGNISVDLGLFVVSAQKK
jgi:trans-aconitate methyltransferase